MGDTAERPSNLEDSLTKFHEERISLAEGQIDWSQQNLARIALIYGGQMHFDFDAAEQGQSA